MKIFKMYKEMLGIFKLPKLSFYLGKVRYGVPYFYPINYCKYIFYIRKLKLTSKEIYEEKCKKYPHLANSDNYKFSNLPLARRTYDKIIKVFNNYYFIQIGYPIKTATLELGWKDKFDSPRLEWIPQFHMFFFGLQFRILFNSPIDDEDRYYEQFIWWYYYSNKDLNKAKQTWPWVDFDTKETTWSNKILK